MATLLEMTLTGGVLILLVLLLRAIFLNRLPKTAFIVMWAVVLLRLLVPVSFFGTTAAETVADTSEVYTLEAVTPTAETEAREVITLNSYNPSTEPTAETAERADLFGIIWLIGAVVCAVVLVLSYILSIRRFSRSENLESDFISAFQSSNKLRRTVTIKLSDKTTTPLTYGIIHPVILLPKGMDLSDEKQLRYVLMHEYIHIRKLDNLLKGISSAAVCIHWFNPLVWVMNKFLSRDIELRCDEALLRQCSGDCRADYALTLIDLEDQRRGYAPATTAFAMRASEERIVAIMKYRKLTPSSVLAMILCIALLCTALVGCGAVEKTESETIDYTEDETSDSIVVLSETTEVTHSDGIYTLEEALSSTISVEGFIAEGYEGGMTDYTFRSVEYTDTLPDGMYISDGIIYNADGEEVGSLAGQLGYEDMVIDGTGEAADGYTFVVIDFDMTNVLEQWHSDDSLQIVCLELYPLFVGMSETSENYFYQYYPIYDNAARVYEYHLTSETVVNYDEVVADAAAKVYEIPEYTVYSYTPFDEGMTCNIRLIYLIGDGAMDMSLYLGLQEFSGTLHTIGQSYVKLN